MPGIAFLSWSIIIPWGEEEEVPIILAQLLT